ncbi:MAG TPA: hypothetical protein VLV78_18395 [Thermoanaerobaculia bacterium]|nr:hypothetical protein [Thermoanaerobaculia bacterium]
MLSTRTLSAVLLVSLLAPAARAACTLNLRQADSTTIAWNAIPGINTYQVQESTDNYATSRNYFITAPSFKINRRASVDTKIVYIVTAMLDTSAASVGPAVEGCTEQLAVTVKGDPEFRTLTRKAVLPIVGSGPGAFGGRFKTTLKLTANGPDQRGRLVFHPAGAIESPSDPSILYSFDGGLGQTVVFDDVVARIGQSGVGSLDIVPDADAASTVPTIEARLFNDTPNGTFGTSTTAFYPFDYLHAPDLAFRIPDAQFRINLGLRTLQAVSARVLIYGLGGRLRDFVDLSWPAGYTIVAPVSQVIGRDVVAGESVQIFFDGAAIPFYTVTENRTNDPELFVAQPSHSFNVGSYVE